MTNRPHRFQKALRQPGASAVKESASLSLTQLSYWADGWLVDCEIRQHSPSTRTTRRMTVNNLLWFLRREQLPCCGTAELRLFFSYLIRGHTEEGGRWGNPQMTRPVRPRTVDTYHGHLGTFFTWVAGQGGLDISPMARLSRPVCRADQIQPFTPDQIEAVLAAARQTQNARRDETIILLLLDTGIRASELCGLRQKDLDMTEKRITVLGKGNKRRSVYFGQRASKAVWSYLRDKEIQEDLPLFPSERGDGKGQHLSRYGLRDMIERLNTVAQVKGVRCSAHTFRHTFAVSFLRAGGQVVHLKEILGHTDIKMTLKYVALAEADFASQRRYSPADQLALRGASGQPRVWARGNKIGGNKIGGKGKPKEKPGGSGGPADSRASDGPPPAAKHHPEKITKAKLTEEQVRGIKTSLAEPDGRSVTQRRAEIADRYSVALSTVKEIALGYTWRHID